jgi:hypothetical protein
MVAAAASVRRGAGLGAGTPALKGTSDLELRPGATVFHRTAAGVPDGARSDTGQVKLMGLLGKATDKVQYELQAVGEYVWTLWDLTSETGQYGEQVKWVWLISPVSNPDAYIMRADGQQEKEIWQFSKPSIAKGSRARAWTEALLGRELKTGEEPDDNDLIRRRMIALLVHKANKNDPTIKREAISEEIPPRPFEAPRQATRPTAVAATATQGDIDQAMVASDADRAEMKKKIKRALTAATLNDIDTTTWAKHDQDALSDDDLQTLLETIEAAVQQAVA